MRYLDTTFNAAPGQRKQSECDHGTPKPWLDSKFRCVTCGRKKCLRCETGTVREKGEIKPCRCDKGWL